MESWIDIANGRSVLNCRLRDKIFEAEPKMGMSKCRTSLQN